MFIIGRNSTLRFLEGEGGDGGGADGAADEAGSRDANRGESVEDTLRKERDARKKAQAEAGRLRAAEKELNDLKAKGATESERAVAQARAEGAAEASKAANERILRAEAKAFAGAMSFHDPSVAVRLLDLATVHVGEDGEFDEDAVKALLKDLAKDSPYLIKGGGTDGEDAGAGGRQDADARRMGAGGRSSGAEPTDPAGRVRAGLLSALNTK